MIGNASESHVKINTFLICLGSAKECDGAEALTICLRFPINSVPTAVERRRSAPIGALMTESRACGTLLHPTSLPGRFGIGDLGPDAVTFLDWLAEAGQTVWQVLPLGPTGYGDSPYAPFSTFAGNELLLSPESLARDGLLLAKELEGARLPGGDRVDYGAAIPRKRALAEAAAERVTGGASGNAGFNAFRRDNAGWLGDYALFVDIKREFDDEAARAGATSSAWNDFWPEALAARDGKALDAWRERRANRLAVIEAEQYLFSIQWDALRSAAAGRGIRVLGDLPIFVAMDSSDAWSRPELFDLDESGKPREVAGVPPDYFAEDGQLWGNPLYAWDRHEAEGFSWWTERIRAALALYDLVRIDHFRGLSACWSVPAGQKTARQGKWRPAPGAALLSTLEKRLGHSLPIVAEDLGFITDEVRELRERFGLPGMRILQFGFDSEESGKGLDPANPFLPHNYSHDCVAYTGTHDNDTLAGWLENANEEERAFIREYLGWAPPDAAGALVREALKSAAGLVVVPAQDILGLGSEARMNVPGTVGGNWSWRLLPGQLDEAAAARMRTMVRIYGRLP